MRFLELFPRLFPIIIETNHRHTSGSSRTQKVPFPLRRRNKDWLGVLRTGSVELTEATLARLTVLKL